jgi:hypothetical protein
MLKNTRIRKARMDQLGIQKTKKRTCGRLFGTHTSLTEKGMRASSSQQQVNCILKIEKRRITARKIGTLTREVWRSGK